MIWINSFLLRFIIACAFVLAASECFSQPISQQVSAHQVASQQQRAERAFRELPFRFEANLGQTDAHVQYLSRGIGYTLFLSGPEAVLVLRRPGDPADTKEVVRLVLDGANPKAQLAGTGLLPGQSRYFLGSKSERWLNVPQYGSLRAATVYSGIDLVYYGNQQQLETDFVVAPGADPRTIVWRIDGAQRLQLDAHGNLLLSIGGGEIVLHAPSVYQNVKGRKIPRRGHYVLRGPNTVGFEIAAYDRTRSLIIDPILSYAAFLGGSGADSANSVAVDANGNIYIAGTTASTNLPLDNSAGVNTDTFVTKISADGSSLLYSTYLGGSAADEAHGLTVDSIGTAYLTGTTHSTDFAIRNALQPSCSLDPSGACSGDAFVAKFDAQGTLVYSTYFGGSGRDGANSIAVDNSGNTYIAGATNSIDLPVVGALQWVASGSGDAFLAKISNDGSRVLYATYLGGSGTDEARAIVADTAENAYVTGSTSSFDFPTHAPLQASCMLDGKNVCADTFITKISADGAALVYSTYLGGSGVDVGNAIAVDSSGSAYLAGDTLSADFPAVKPIQAVSSGSSKAFVSKLAPDGSSLLFSTYLGGSVEDHAYAVAVDGAGNVFVAGGTRSSDLPLKDPLQSACKKDSTGVCSEDAFIAVLDPKGASLEFATYLGGSGRDEARSVVVDAKGVIYLAGTTTSPDFPSTSTSQISNLSTKTVSVSSGNSSTNSGYGFVAKITGANVVGSSGTPAGVDEYGTATSCSGTSTNWIGGVGNWSNAAMWSTGVVPNSTATNVCIDGGNDAASQVTVDINVSVGTITVDSNDTLILADNIVFVVAGGIANSGQILLNGGSGYTYLQIQAGKSVALTGGGTVTMSSTGHNLIYQQTTGGGSILTNVDNTIQGAGQIGWNGLGLVNQASGTINGNGAVAGVGILINASVVTNTGLIEASGGGILLISPAGQVSGGGGNPVVNNNGGSIVSNGSGSTVQLSSATIQGGTLNTIGGGVLGTQTSGIVTLDGTTHTLTNAGTYTAATASITVLVGTITNTGTILVDAASGSPTWLQMATGLNVTLTGAGKVTMANTGYALIAQQTSSGNSILTNVNNTIQGPGQIGNNGLAVVNQTAGVINSNFTSTSIGMLINAPAITNAGLIEATNGGLLQISGAGSGFGVPTINNAGGNIVSSGSGSTVQLAATIQGGTLKTLSDGVLGTPASNTATLDGSTQGTLTNAGTYTAGTASATILVGTITNTGTILIDAASGSPTWLQMAAGQNVTLTGGGTVTMSNTGYALIAEQTANGNSTLINVNNTIQGTGQIGNNGLALVNQAAGIINANFTSTSIGILINAPAVTNAGLIEATNGGLLLVSNSGYGNVIPIVNNSGGSIVSNGSGSTVQFSNATIQGGTLNTFSSGALGTAGSSTVTLDGNTHGTLTNAGTYTAATASITLLVGTINNTGTILINAASGSPTWLQVATGQNVTLTGAGTVTTSNSGYALIAEQTTNGNSTLTNVNNTIQGTTQIGNNGLALVNQAAGKINANVAGAWILLNAPAVTNAGLIEATNGGFLQVSNSGYGYVIPIVNNAGGSIVSNGSGSSVQFSNVTIQGGTLNTLNSGVLGTPTGNAGVVLDGSTHGALTNAGTYTEADNSVTIILGTINNTGNFQMNGTNPTIMEVATGQSATFTGAGTVTMSGVGNNYIGQQTSNGGSTLTNATNTIQGNGQIGWNGLALVNSGTLLANSTNGLVVTASTFTNNGTVQTNNLCPLSISTGNSLMTNEGNVFVYGGGTMVVFGTYTQTAGGTQVDGSLEADLLNINGGTLFGNGGTISGPTNLAGVLRPGDTVITPGALRIDGTYSQTSAGAYNVVIGGLSPGTQFGQVNIENSSTLSGTLNASLINGFSPLAGNSFTILNSGSRTGTFTSTNLPALTCGGAWQVSYTTTSAVLSIVNPAPTISTLSPSSVVAGDAGFTLTVNGSGFVCGSSVSFNGNARTTTFVSPTQLTATIPASDVTTAGIYNVTVTNPAPGGGTSSAVTFTVNNPTPVITTISPSSTLVGSGAFNLTVNGTGFVSTSTVRFNGNARTTTFVSATQLSAAIQASDVAAAGTYNVTVNNPTPGGGTSNAMAFAVNNPVPAITNISPTSATAGGVGFTLTVNGANFLSSSTVSFNGSTRATTFVSATQVTAAILASDIATGGSFNVTVTNPSPGGGASNSVSFTVNNPAPTVTTLSPATATAGGIAFNLTVNGTNFVGSSIVNFNGNALSTTFVSATQLTASITASDIASVGSYNVTVTNPTPGGGTSNAVSFTVNNPVPTVTTLSPVSANAGGTAFTLTVNGTNFVGSSTVRFNGNTRTTTFVSATQLTAAILASDIATAGTFNVTVTNPTPGGGTSNAVTFTVNNPIPSVTTISPNSATAGGTAFALTVNGTNFISGSTVNFNGIARTTTFVSATQITAAILASDIATAGTFNVTVTNPLPGGGTSSAVTFTVNNPAPTINTVSPTSATAGGTAFTLTVNGTGFVSTSVVKFGANTRTTTFVSSTQVTAALQASDIATGGTFNVTVTNPSPGGGTSNAVSFAVNNPGPAITSISPTSAAVGGASFTLTVNGTGFVSSSTVSFNGSARTTTFVNAAQLTAAIPASDIASAGNYNITVTNPSPGGGTSTAVVFLVSAPNPVPTITTISPASATAGSAAFTLTVNGTNFINTSTINFNGSPRTTTYISATQLTAAISASDIATASSYNVTVTNPTPGGGTSNAVSFMVNNPLPTITTLSPSSTTAGVVAFTLTVNGTGFVANSTVSFNGNARATTFVSATQLTAAIPASDIATAGNYNVTVTNPSPGGGTSTAVTFVVSAMNPVPTITTLSPTSATAGGGAFTLAVNGANFVNSSTVKFNGNTRATTFISATQLTAAIPASDIATGGTFNLTVTNPTPGGGTSNSVAFTVNNPAPTITTISPTSATAGGAAFTLTVNGTNFVDTSSVSFNGTARTTTFISATQLTAAIPASDIATAGNYNVTVTNPSPGGGTSTAVTFVVSAPNPAPTITTISPTSALAGSAAFTLTVNGTNFISTSTVSFNGNVRTTTFVSATKLTAAVQASDVATAGTLNVTVTNPAPGGGTSNAVTFTVNNPVPTITTISPTSATAGGVAFTLTVNGTGFVASSAVSFSGSARTTTFVSSTQLTAAIQASDIAIGGTFDVTVNNASPGGGTSNAVSFIVSNPVPAITTISPTSVMAGGGAFTFTVNGTNFVHASNISLDGSALATTFVSDTQITAAVPASLIASPKTINVVVTNPAPGGGTSNVVTLTVTDFTFDAASGGSTTVAVTAGQTATYNLQLTPANGFTGTVSLSCSGAPSLAVCTVSPSSLPVSGLTAPFTVTVSTTAPSIAGVLRDRPANTPMNRTNAALFGMAMLAMVAGVKLPRRRSRRVLAPALAVIALAFFSACGGGGSTPPNPSGGTPKGTYTLTVTGSSGGVSRSIPLTLTVK